jgi:single-strand DNA-binding protein
MGSLNKVQLIGNLGRDVDLRFTADGTAVATVNMATSERYTDKAGVKKEIVEWHRVSIWGKTAEALSEFLTKGKQIYVEGKLQTQKWQDKAGVDRYSTTVRADRVLLLGKKEGGSYAPHPADSPDSVGAGPEFTPQTEVDDDIPF